MTYWKQASKKDKVIFLFFFLLPLLNYSHYLIPEDSQTINFFFFELSALGFYDTSELCFHLIRKTSLLTFFLIWYLSEKDWLRFAVITPIILLSNQLYNCFDVDVIYIDEIEILQSGPYLLLLALFLILLAKLVDNQEKIKLVLEDRYSQLEQLVEERLEKRETRIESNREKIKSNNLKTEELQKIREELEKELKRKV